MPSRAFPFYLDGKTYELNAIITPHRCRLTARATKGDFTISCEARSFAGALERLTRKLKGLTTPDEYHY